MQIDTKKTIQITPERSLNIYQKELLDRSRVKKKFKKAWVDAWVIHTSSLGFLLFLVGSDLCALDADFGLVRLASRFSFY